MEAANGIVAGVAIVTVVLMIAVSGLRWVWKQLRKMMPPVWVDEEDTSFAWRCPMCGANYDEEGGYMP